MEKELETLVICVSQWIQKELENTTSYSTGSVVPDMIRKLEGLIESVARLKGN